MRKLMLFTSWASVVALVFLVLGYVLRIFWGRQQMMKPPVEVRLRIAAVKSGKLRIDKEKGAYSEPITVVCGSNSCSIPESILENEWIRVSEVVSSAGERVPVYLNGEEPSRIAYRGIISRPSGRFFVIGTLPELKASELAP